jgi:hypothetical protein
LPTEASAIQAAAQPKPSRGKSVAAVVAFVMIVLFAAGAAKWVQNAKLAAKLPPLTAPIAPKLPDFALTQPASEPPSPASDTQTAAAAAPLTAAASAPTQAPSSTPAGSNPAITKNLPAEPDQSLPNMASGAAQPMGSVLRGNAPSYIWVARFDREDRAQDASRKIQGLGLTSVVVPRRMEGGKRGFVVLSGPFPSARIPSVIDWLRAQGFKSVREVKISNGQLHGRNPALDKTYDFDGSTE